MPLLLRLLALSWPLLLSQLASVSLSLIDTIIVGQVSTTELAAVAMGSSIFIALMLSFSGILQANLPLSAHRAGAKDFQAVGALSRQGLWLSLILGILGIVILQNAAPLLLMTGGDSAVVVPAEQYLSVLSWGLPFMLAQRSLQVTANSVGHPRPMMAITLSQPIFHAVVCYALVHHSHVIVGRTLAPSFAAALAEVATLILGFCGSALIVGKGRVFQPYGVMAKMEGLHLHTQLKLLKIGTPIGIAYAIEVFAFSGAALLLAKLGAESVSAHRIILNFATVLYMVPYSLATASAGMVARSLGAQDIKGAHELIKKSMAFSVLLSLLLGGVFWALKEQLIPIASPDSAVQSIVFSLAIYVCAFQTFDAGQTMATFFLRAYHITLTPLIVYGLSFGLLGLGLGSYLAYDGAHLGVAGYWIGLVIATMVAFILLGSMLWWRVQKERKSFAFA